MVGHLEEAFEHVLYFVVSLSGVFFFSQEGHELKKLDYHESWGFPPKTDPKVAPKNLLPLDVTRPKPPETSRSEACG